MVRKSRVFTNAELAELERRRSGDRSDKQGLFSSRVRPKIDEIVGFDLDELKALTRRMKK